MQIVNNKHKLARRTYCNFVNRMEIKPKWELIKKSNNFPIPDPKSVGQLLAATF